PAAVCRYQDQHSFRSPPGTARRLFFVGQEEPQLLTLPLQVLELDVPELRLQPDQSLGPGTFLPGRDYLAVEPYGNSFALTGNFKSVPLAGRMDLFLALAGDLHALDFAVRGEVGEQVGHE